MIYLQHPRDSIIENVEKLILCGTPAFGGAMYACPCCGNFKFVPFRCHSRFCPSCGNMYSIDRTTSMSFKILDVQHRHCVFTIAEELRPFFLHNRSLLNCLFSAVNSVVTRMFHKENLSELFTPGFICVLHTFGRNFKWNPHIHCLISEGGVGKSLFWRHKKHFNFRLLRDSFQTALLNELHSRIGFSFKKVKAFIYSNHKKGFMFMQSPINAILQPSSNISVIILAGRLSPPPALIPMMVRLSHFIITATKMINSLWKRYLFLTLSPV